MANPGFLALPESITFNPGRLRENPMKLSVDISLYPLRDEFIPPIDAFIADLNEDPAVEVLTNSMATQLWGDYDAVMALLNKAIKTSFKRYGKQIFVAKFLLGDTRDLAGIK